MSQQYSRTENHQHPRRIGFDAFDASPICLPWHTTFQCVVIHWIRMYRDSIQSSLPGSMLYNQTIQLCTLLWLLVLVQRGDHAKALYIIWWTCRLMMLLHRVFGKYLDQWQDHQFHVEERMELSSFSYFVADRLRFGESHTLSLPWWLQCIPEGRSI